MNSIRIIRNIKFEIIRKCHLLWHDYTFKKIAINKKLVPFTCNICGTRTAAQLVDICSREKPSCTHCGSNLRMRSVIHLLSTELFGKSLPLPEFPTDKTLIGLGMSDRQEYAETLSEKLSYTNTYYHREPKFDITSLETTQRKRYDFIISCDVFEHIVPPTQNAFNNLNVLLKNDGVAILTIPYMLFENTWEHFPELNNFNVISNSKSKKLINITLSGQRQEFTNLSFHGGQGATLELRIFTKSSIKQELKKSGFKTIKFAKCNEPNFGIIWPLNWSLPIVARR